jgi:SRSO17 transposase
LAVTEQDLRSLAPALEDFLHSFLYCCAYTQTFDHLGVYCKGLLSDLPRKSVEPIALASGTPVRTLQEFLRDHDWDRRRLTDLAQQHTAGFVERLPDDDLGTIGLIDETAVPKKGTKTPGVQRQYCGRLGKVENCVVSVHLGVARGRYRAIVGGDLYLPQAWARDRDRCREAGIPDEVVYRPKWRIALEQIDGARQSGLAFDWLTFDAEYGKRPEFLTELAARGIDFVGEVPTTFSCRLADGQEERPAPRVRARAADRLLVEALADRAVVVRARHETIADEIWQVVERRVWIRQGKGYADGVYRLLCVYNANSRQMKFFVSNAGAAVAVQTLVRVGLARAAVEHGFRVLKSELGFGHYEGRNYTGLMRHLALCCAMAQFVAQQAQQRRKKMSSGR